jgi:ABC-type nickel/cobalt efflux system permease component RcnA
MFGLDEHVAELAAGQGLFVALLVAVLLGLRHATDPDHLTAVSTLVLSEDERGTSKALRLGLAWGAGHGVTILLLGLPVVLVGEALPDTAQRVAEFSIGLIIIALAVRLIRRWQRGYFHVHEHEHDGVRHAHPHVHEHADEADHPHVHAHEHPESLGRSPRAAFGIGLAHGIGGSAGVSVLLIGAISSDAEAVTALALFAAATALSMALVSSLFGRALATGPARRRFATLAPGFGSIALLFGAWYALGATGAVPYVL